MIVKITCLDKQASTSILSEWHSEKLDCSTGLFPVRGGCTTDGPGIAISKA